MKFTVEKSNNVAILKLQEDKLNTLIAPDFKSELVLLNTEGRHNIIFDMEGVTFVDSSGLSAILRGNKLCEDSKGVFILTHVSESILSLIQISKLDSFLKIIPTLSESTDFVAMTELEKELNLGESEEE